MWIFLVLKTFWLFAISSRINESVHSSRHWCHMNTIFAVSERCQRINSTWKRLLSLCAFEQNNATAVKPSGWTKKKKKMLGKKRTNAAQKSRWEKVSLSPVYGKTRFHCEYDYGHTRIQNNCVHAWTQRTWRICGAIAGRTPHSTRAVLDFFGFVLLIVRT